jgi:hypothetical protein
MSVLQPFEKLDIKFTVYLLIVVNFLAPGSGSAFPNIREPNQC